ncbi:voltage-dependent calcium channel gamma-like subunit [Oncorhynchus kisutch]|nr:voltage-dependent calcium channel gamma-like subunit [Oncorhynchus kisutch]
MVLPLGQVEYNTMTAIQIKEHPDRGVSGVAVGLVLCRSMVSLAVVGAIFGLELLVISQVIEDRDSGRRCGLGSALVLVAAALSVGGVVMLVSLLRQQASPLGFTLTFWCQFTAVFLLFLNGMAAPHPSHGPAGTT